MSGLLLASTLILATATASAESQIAISMQPEKGCSIIPLEYGTSLTNAERTHSGISFTVKANAYCGVEPQNPTIVRNMNSATISVSYDTTKALHNCICTKTISFDISNLPEEVKTLHFVQDGYVTGHSNVP